MMRLASPQHSGFTDISRDVMADDNCSKMFIGGLNWETTEGM